MTSPGPSPGELWRQADGNGDRYRELMREHGYLVPGTPEPLPCGWPAKRVEPTADDDQAAAVEAYRAGRRKHAAECRQTDRPTGARDCCVAAGLAAVFAAGFRDGFDPPDAA